MDDLTQVLQDTFRADGRNQPVGRARVRRWHRLVARAMEEFNDALEVLGDIAAPAHTNTARHGNGNSPAIANGNGASNGANTNANTPSPSLNAAGNQS
jgi:hypothetical protein